MEGGIVANSGSLAAWLGFGALVIVLLVLDLFVFHKKEHADSHRQALGWSIFWVAISLLFGAGVWIWDGADKGLEYLTGYVVEKALSVDNLFVFLATFAYFRVPAERQHRVLFWGVIGALVMRGFFIFIGGALLHAFDWVMYVFGAFLVVTGVKLLFEKEHGVDPEHNPVLKVFRRFVPATKQYHDGRFVVRDPDTGRRLATPLLFVLVVIEASDVMFAVDSVPAVFAVTDDVFIVYTSNIFAILGLRALYSLLAAYIAKFSHLRYGLAGVLAFVGVKMLIADWWHVPVLLSLGIIALMLTAAIVASAMWPGTPEPLPEGAIDVLPEEDRAAVAPGAVTAGVEGRPETAERPPR